VLLAAEVLLADEVFVEFVEFTGALVFVAPLGAANILSMLNC
jgi:hypothetical protein